MTTKPRKKQHCRTCRHLILWSPNGRAGDGWNDWEVCQRHAPGVLLSGQDVGETTWPQMVPDEDGCGEWEAKSEDGA